MSTEQIATVAWAIVGILTAILVCLGGLFWAMFYGYRSIVKGLREDISYHQRQLTDLRALIAAEREDCEARIARQNERIEVLERRAGVRE